MTLPLRRVVFWMHLSAGLAAGVVVLVMSVTGVILAYEKQMIRWADGYRATPAAGQARLPLDELVSKAVAERPAAASGSIVVRRDPAAPVEISAGREGSLFLNAYTGEVLGSGSAKTRSFFRSTMEWHRWLAMKDASRATGKMITGVSNLVFLFIVISGFYLWWPRTWTWPQFRQVLWFRRGLPSKARDFNWHHVIGYWSLVPLAVIVWSGSVIGYPWASDLTYRMVGEAPPARPQPGATRPGEPRPGEGRSAEGRRDAEAPAVPSMTLAQLLTVAEQRSPEWTILTARLPRPEDRDVQVTVDTGTGAQPQKKGTLQLDRSTGAVKKWEPFEAQSRGRQWRSWMRFAHTGEYYGLTGQTIAMLVTAGSVVLVWTGFALTWRRFRAWRARSASAAVRASRSAAA
ncbi:MAG TPA: PepSY-associated TM helix domain-containing protein [Luteitalea sp.]|nr:PepSY-associated TM helix domain-containing protein [Luteitalea sp.]